MAAANGTVITKRDAGDSMMTSFKEMQTLLHTHYERTGDLALQPVLERADHALRMLRGVMSSTSK
jgi:hypothetical protein